MNIMGVDPGLANLGWGVISWDRNTACGRTYGHVTTSSSTPTIERIASLADSIQRLLQEHSIDILAIEDIYYYQNKSSAVSVAKVIGAICYAASLLSIPVVLYSPLQIKTTVTGFGRADKNQIQQMVRVLLGLESIPKPDHAADALAIALCHALQSEGKMRIEGQ